MFKITEILCEYRKNPIGLGECYPRLMWKLSTDDAVQTAYRVIVCSSQEAARQGMGDLWDSGVVDSSTAFIRNMQGNHYSRENNAGGRLPYIPVKNLLKVRSGALRSGYCPRPIGRVHGRQCLRSVWRDDAFASGI